MDRYSYEIEPRADERGGGCRLHLLEKNPETGELEEVGGGVFSATSDEESRKAAWQEAMDTAENWLMTRPDEPVCERVD